MDRMTEEGGVDRDAVVIDIDDTLVDIGERRVELFRRHFPHAAANAEDVRFDIGLKGIGERSSAPARKFLEDFANPAVVAELPVAAVPGAVEAVGALEAAGLEVVLLTSRAGALRECTLADLESIGLDWHNKKLIMYEPIKPMDPSDDTALEAFKFEALRAIAHDVEVIAMVGNSRSDVTAAFAARIPAILLHTSPVRSDSADLHRRAHVGFQECDNWGRALVEIGTFRTGEKQVVKLRDGFTAAYTTWLSNLNHLCAIDVAVASVLAALSGRAILESSLHSVSRFLAVVPLVLALIALVFAIRAFTSKYSSGATVGRPIAPRFRQAISILLNLGDTRSRAREGDAIFEYSALRKTTVGEQASAHRQFFYSRYRTNNPQALMNLRMFEMRSLNYVRAYAEHLASRILIWTATSLVLWVIGVSFLDPSIRSGVGATQSATPVVVSVPATAPTGPGSSAAESTPPTEAPMADTLLKN